MCRGDTTLYVGRGARFDVPGHWFHLFTSIMMCFALSGDINIMSLSHQVLDQTSLNSSTVYVIYLLLFINNIVCHVGLSQARYTRVILYVWLVAASYRVRQEKRTLTKSIISQNWRIIFKSYLFVDIKLIQICQTGHLGRKPSSNWCPYQSTTINTGEKPNTHADIKLNQFKNPIYVWNS